MMSFDVVKNAHRNDVTNTAMSNPKLIMEFCLAANLASVKPKQPIQICVVLAKMSKHTHGHFWDVSRVGNGISEPSYGNRARSIVLPTFQLSHIGNMGHGNCRSGKRSDA